MGLVKDFRDFALKGNVVDLAVGVIIGAAFGGLIKSLVDDVLMPPIGKIAGNLDFSNQYISLSDKIDQANAAVVKQIAATQPGVGGGIMSTFSSTTRLPLAKAKELGPVIAYGNFITGVINFLIIAFCVFLLIKAMTMAMKRFEKEKAAEPAPTPPDVVLLTEIRDLLKSNR